MRTRALLLLIASVFAASTVSAQSTFGDEFIRSELERVVTDPDNAVTISVEAPVDYVYRFLMERLDLYTENAVSVTFDSGLTSENPPRVGTERTTLMEEGGTLVQRFLLIEPSNRYAYFTDIEKSTLDAPLKYSLGNYEFREISPNKTEVDISVVYQPSSRLTGFIVRRLFNSAFRRDFTRAAAVIGDKYREQTSINSAEVP